MNIERELENNKVADGFAKELSIGFGNIFDHTIDKISRMEGLNKALLKLKIFIQLIPDGEAVSRQILDCAEIEDRETFVQRVLEIFEPLIAYKTNNPVKFEEVRREFFVEEAGSTKLNEILSYELNGDEVSLHLSPARELIKTEGFNGLMEEVEKGLIILANIVDDNKEIQEITGTSWIVANNPRLMKKLGFTVIHGEINDEPNPTGGNRSISKAFISRDDFLDRYLKR